MDIKVTPNVTAKNFSIKNILGSKNNENIKVNYNTKPDTFSMEEFGLDAAIDKLKELKTTNLFGKETSKFSGSQLNKIKNSLTKEPKKWNSVYAMAQKDYLSAKTVTAFSNEALIKLDTLKEYSDVQDSKSKPRYTNDDLVLFNNTLNEAQIVKLKPMTKTSLEAKNIAGLKTFPESFINKASDKILDFEKNVCNDDVKKIVFTRNNSEKDAFNIQAVNNDSSLINMIVLDKNLNTESVEQSSVYQTKDKVYEIKKTEDFRNHTVSKVRMEIDEKLNMPTVTHEVRVVKDKNDNVLKTEYTSPSEVPGVFNIKIQYPNGKTEVVSSGKVDKKHGITTVKKNMTSLDGTKTEYLYEDDINGNRISEYKITDKNGNVLLNKNSTFEVVSPNKIISSNNNDVYEITINDKTIDVQDKNNPERKATIDIDRGIVGNKAKILQSLKSMPGEELIKVAQTTNRLVGIDSPLESFYQPADKSIHSGDQLFVILHELGHARDYRDLNLKSDEGYYKTINTLISNDEKLTKIFEDEKKNFTKAFPEAQRDHIDYFINTVTHYNGETGGLMETVAESNALLTTPKTMDILAIRSQYLQQYFPKTIAYISDELSKEKVA